MKCGIKQKNSGKKNKKLSTVCLNSIQCFCYLHDKILKYGIMNTKQLGIIQQDLWLNNPVIAKECFKIIPNQNNLLVN